MRWKPSTRWARSDREPIAVVLVALAADGIAVHRQGVQEKFGVRALRVCALPMLSGMPDEGPVTVRTTCPAFPTVVPHRPFLTPWGAPGVLPRRDSLKRTAPAQGQAKGPQKDLSAMTSPTDSVETVACPVCGAAVPAGVFCGCCGAELAAPPTFWRTLLRPRAFAAAPGERLIQPMVTSSLFPHLERPSRSPFRIGLLLLFAALSAFSWLRLVGPLITVAGLGVPVLFVLYLWQTDVYKDMPRRGLAVSAVIGTALGVGWTLFTGGVVARAYGIPMAAGFALEQVLSVGLAVALVGAVLMVLPAVVVRLLRPPHRESLDGFEIGALGALMFTGASTITNFAPQFVSGLINNVRPLRLAVHAALYGVAAPLTAGASGGLIGIMLWFRPGARALAHPGRVRTALLFFSLLVVALYAAIWVMEAARLPQIIQLVLHLVLAFVALIALRVAMQLALLQEATDPPYGQPLLCVQCDRVVPDMPFCPACGVAGRASSRTSRRLRRQSPPVRKSGNGDAPV